MGFSRLSYETLRSQLGLSKGASCRIEGNSSTELAAARSKFRVRSLQRDQQNDSIRKRRLEKVLNTLVIEVENEVNGLKNRLAKDTNDAAFLMDAIENDDVSVAEAGRVNDLESSVVYACERVKLLNRQIDFLNEFSELAQKYPL